MKYRHLTSDGVKGKIFHSALPANQWESRFPGREEKQLWFQNLVFWMILLFFSAQVLADIVPIPIENTPLKAVIQPSKTPPTSVTEKSPLEAMGSLDTVDLPTAIQKASRAVWMLNGKEEKVSVHEESDFLTVTTTISISNGGSGFFINGSRLIFTNFHVVSSLLKGGLSKVTLSQNGVESGLKIKSLLALCAVADIALLETDSEAPFYLSLRDEPLFEDEDLTILGYPDRAFRVIRKGGPLAFFFKGFWEFPTKKKSSKKGASGGPVIDSRGQVVGIFKRSNDDVAIFTGVNQLKAILEGEIGVRCGKNSPEKCFKKAVTLAKRRGFEGDAEAQYALSIMYEEGFGVEQEEDAGESFFWLKKAAKKGHAYAQYDLGFMYVALGEERVNYDPKTAAFWLEKSSKQGHGRAKYLLDWLTE